MPAAPLSRVEPLTSAHDTSQFDCGEDELSRWLTDHALASQLSDGVRVWVVHRAGHVVGYYALTSAAVIKAEAPPRTGRGLGNYPIPVILLARLAVDRSEQGAGLGKALFKDALRKAAAAAEIVGSRALLIHAIDERARAFYQQFDVEESPTDPLHLFLLMKDIRAILRP